MVLSDCQVDFNIPGVKPLCPDLALFFGVRRRIAWSSFNVAEEGARPVLVAEITSPDTRSNDLGIKMDYYHRAEVPWYVIADVTSRVDDERRIELILYRRTRTGYRRVKPDERAGSGSSRSGSGWARFATGSAGSCGWRASIPTPARRSAITRRSAGPWPRPSGSSPSKRARAEAERARADAERARADAEKARAEAEERTRDSEAALAEALARIRRLESSEGSTSSASGPNFASGKRGDRRGGFC